MQNAGQVRESERNIRILERTFNAQLMEKVKREPGHVAYKI